jgi:hypothetical protein
MGIKRGLSKLNDIDQIAYGGNKINFTEPLSFQACLERSTSVFAVPGIFG